MTNPRVLLADDHTLVLEGFKKLLEPRFDVVGTVGNGRELVEEAPKLDPEIILVDISMPLLNGIEAARQLKKTVPRSKIVFLSMHADPEYVTEAFKAGGCGYLLKRSAGSELIFALEEVLKGRYYVTPLVAKTVVNGVRRDEGGVSSKPPLSHEKLTPRQKEVLQLVAEGKALKEIAAILDVSVKTVEFHKSRIMDALDLRTTAELTKYAVSHGVTSLE
jgi:DNA-binding NarL/FixJ family response regulator